MFDSLVRHIVEGLYYLCRENKGADQLFSHMQKASFLMSWLNYIYRNSERFDKVPETGG